LTLVRAALAEETPGPTRQETEETRVKPLLADGGGGPLATGSAGVRLQAFAYEHRNVLAGLPVVIAFLAVHDTVGLVPLLAAASLGLLGAALRAWCTLYNRFAQGERKTLATAGPYAWLRNPIYVGNTLVLLGCALASGLAWLVPVTCAWAFLVYDQVVRHEERRLLAKYGDAYREYQQRVPRWIPRLTLEPLAQLRPGFPRALLMQSPSLLPLVPFAAKAWLFAG
jgi:protein-S-isoprenylcysteine O-methyltransferase Ste14